MNSLILTRTKNALCVALLASASVWTASAAAELAHITVQGLQGNVTYSIDGTHWQALKSDSVLSQGAAIRTTEDATADLLLKSSGTVLRVTPGTTMEVTTLRAITAGEDVVTQTRLNVTSGGVVGSQRKLTRPSTFEIDTPTSVATIVGTVYQVNGNGGVACFNGAVAVCNNNAPKVTVPAGCAFDPKTCKVTPTPPVVVASCKKDVDCVNKNAKDCGMGNHDGGGNDNNHCPVSPTTPTCDNNHGNPGNGGNNGNNGNGNGNNCNTGSNNSQPGKR